uniref:Uncharacterized protein n=1 Tax=Anguilla anguilla TaxID=7936 RepID=A0A0E9XMQ2_ANGAN
MYFTRSSKLKSHSFDISTTLCYTATLPDGGVGDLYIWGIKMKTNPVEGQSKASHRETFLRNSTTYWPPPDISARCFFLLSSHIFLTWNSH